MKKKKAKTTKWKPTMWERKYRSVMIWVEFFSAEDLGSQDKRKPFNWGVGVAWEDLSDDGWSKTLREAMKAAERSVDDALKKA